VSYVNHTYRRADVTRRNGIFNQTQRYLDTLGSWHTYRDLGSIDEVPERIAQLTAAYFGLKGLTKGHLRLSGVLGFVIFVHALEQVTGGAATTGMRLYGRGQPVASYRGLTIRQSPFTPKIARILDQMTGGRVLAADGCYFFESGRTWHCQSLILPLGDEHRTLTWLQTFSLPQREFFFDRPVTVPGNREPGEGERTISIQRIIEMIIGDEPPEAIPGFIGSVNELESLTPLRPIKLLFFLTQWLLIDPAERDNASGPVDYGTVVKGLGGTGSGGATYQAPRQPTGPTTSCSLWPSTSRATPGRPPASTPPPPPPPPPAYEADPFGPRPSVGSSMANGPAGSATPAARYKDRLRIEGRDYPLVIKRVLTSPLNGGQRKVDAVYFDDRLGQWCEVVDEETRISLARAVEAGLVSVIDPAYWPMN
jgi:hypothetical protein